MDRDVPIRALRRAADIVGGREKLRNRLSVEPHTLELWLAGRATPPERVMDIVMDLVLRSEMARSGSAPRTRILMALASDAVERLSRVLAGHDLHVVANLHDAMERLAHEAYGMVIIGVYFDESRMFELLHHVRINRWEPAVPVVCILGMEGALSKVVVEGLDHATKSLMANAFLDLTKIPDDDRGTRRIRRIIDHLILVDGDLHQGLEENEPGSAATGDKEA